MTKPVANAVLDYLDTAFETIKAANDTQLDSYIAKNSALEHQVSQQADEIAALKYKIATAMDTSQKPDDLLQQALARATNFEIETVHLKETIAGFMQAVDPSYNPDDQLREVLARTADLEIENIQYKDKIASLERAMDLFHKLDEPKIDHDLLKIDHDQLKIEADTLKIENNNLKIENGDLRHQLQDFQQVIGGDWTHSSAPALVSL